MQRPMWVGGGGLEAGGKREGRKRAGQGACQNNEHCSSFLNSCVSVPASVGGLHRFVGGNKSASCILHVSSYCQAGGWLVGGMQLFATQARLLCCSMLFVQRGQTLRNHVCVCVCPRDRWIGFWVAAAASTHPTVLTLTAHPTCMCSMHTHACWGLCPRAGSSAYKVALL